MNDVSISSEVPIPKEDRSETKTLPVIENVNKNKTLSSHRGEKSGEYYSVSPTVQRDSSIKRLR
jgi:hypothetical protein